MGYFLYFPRLYFGDLHSYNFINLFQVGQLPLEIDGADKAHPNLADMNEAGAAIANWSIFGDFLDCFYFYWIKEVVFHIFIEGVLEIQQTFDLLIAQLVGLQEGALQLRGV